MRWQRRRQSSNVEDRRGMSGGRIAFGGGIGGILIVVILSLLLGKSPLQLLQNMDTGVSTEQTTPGTQTHDEEADFAKVALADTEDVWGRLFAQMGKQYQPPTMVLFSGSVRSACGLSSAATGLFIVRWMKSYTLTCRFSMN